MTDVFQHEAFLLADAPLVIAATTRAMIALKA